MTPEQELDSPRSEVAAGQAGQASTSGVPAWERCDVHRMSFIFECRLCAGSTLGYGL